MSFKAKDLKYEAEEPAFLRRLRSQNSGQTADGRHERPVARARRVKVDEEEDAPAYVVEDSNETMSKDEYEALIKKEGQAQDPVSGGQDETPGITGNVESDEPSVSGALPDDPKEPTIKEATFGNKKRKTAKVVGEDEDEQQMDKTETPRKKPKKKGKPIKLSFDDTAE